jgi:hypothetical protein
METVLGVFDVEYIDQALQALYDYGFEKDQIKQVNRERSVEGPDVGSSEVVALNPVNTTPPLAVGSYNAGEFGADLSALGRGDAAKFYRNAVANGATVLIIKAKDSVQADDARWIMRKMQASNVSESPTDSDARV